MLEKIYDEVEIAQRNQEMARRMAKSCVGEELLLVGILNGASTITPDLMCALPFPCRYNFIQEKRLAEEMSRVSFMGGNDWSEFQGNILLLKDVMLSGIIESYLLTQIKSSTVRHVGVGCAIDMPGDQKADLSPDFSLFMENEGAFAGCEMEYPHSHGNQPYIARVIGG